MYYKLHYKSHNTLEFSQPTKFQGVFVVFLTKCQSSVFYKTENRKKLSEKVEVFVEFYHIYVGHTLKKILLHLKCVSDIVLIINQNRIH